MSYLEIDHNAGKNIYLDVLEDLITLLCDFRDKVIKEMENDNEL